MNPPGPGFSVTAYKWRIFGSVNRILCRVFRVQLPRRRGEPDREIPRRPEVRSHARGGQGSALARSAAGSSAAGGACSGVAVAVASPSRARRAAFGAGGSIESSDAAPRCSAAPTETPSPSKCWRRFRSPAPTICLSTRGPSLEARRHPAPAGPAYLERCNSKSSCDGLYLTYRRFTQTDWAW